MPDEPFPQSAVPDQSIGQAPDSSFAPAAPAPGTAPPGPPSPGGAAFSQPAGADGADFRSTLASRGIDASQFGSDQQAIEYYSRLSPQYVQNLAQQAQLAQRLLPEFRRMQAELQARAEGQGVPPAQAAAQAGAQAAAAQQDQQKKYFWQERPEWQEEWADRLRRDPQTGRMTLADPMLNPALVEKYEAFNNWQRRGMRELLDNPREAIGIDQRFEELFEKKKEELGLLTKGEVQQAQQTQFASDYVAQHAPLLFQGFDQVSGQYIPTDFGTQFHQNLTRMVQANDEQTMADLALLATVGMQAVRSGYGGNGQAQPQIPQQQPAPAQQFMPQSIPYGQQPFLGATYDRNRQGTILQGPLSAVPQQSANNSQDVEAALRAGMQRAGMMQ